MIKVLIIDDEENIRTSLKSALSKRDYDVITAANITEGEKFSKSGCDVIFLDIKLPDGNGIDLLKKIKESDRNQTVIMISGHADIETAVQAIRLGAYDFIEKPISLDRLLVTLNNASQKSRLTIERDRLSAKLYGEIIGQSESIEKLKEDIRHSADKTTRFLINGESGTGKELVAHMIHSYSRFADGPFIAVNCAALPAELIEAELFGHTAGAFSGAKKSRLGRFVEANNGSIFLDEISEMSLSAQAKILRVIESNEITAVGSDKTQKISCNIIAASNKDLNQLAKENNFRHDLLYRLNVVQYEIEPLRDRKEDIPLLAEHFLNRFADETGNETKKLSSTAIKLINNYPFPGNVRELKNLMERLNIYCRANIVTPDDLKPLLPDTYSDDSATLKDAVDKFEKNFIKKSLADNKNRVTETARQLGIERSHLYKKIKKYDIK